jgi:hypothetical protein
MSSGLLISIRMGSASIATLLTCLLLPIMSSGRDKHAIAFVFVGAIAITVAGWLYAGLKTWITGLG